MTRMCPGKEIRLDMKDIHPSTVIEMLRCHVSDCSRDSQIPDPVFKSLRRASRECVPSGPSNFAFNFSSLTVGLKSTGLFVALNPDVSCGDSSYTTFQSPTATSPPTPPPRPTPHPHPNPLRKASESRKTVHSSSDQNCITPLQERYSPRNSFCKLPFYKEQEPLMKSLADATVCCHPRNKILAEKAKVLP